MALSLMMSFIKYWPSMIRPRWLGDKYSQKARYWSVCLSKAYEGFLKKLFKDIGFISHLDYISDHLRLGKLMSPNLIGRLGERSLYKKIQDKTSVELAERVWSSWKTGRNQIFHYFPHNLKAVTFKEAEAIVGEIIKTMQEVFEKLRTGYVLKRLQKQIAVV